MYNLVFLDGTVVNNGNWFFNGYLLLLVQCDTNLWIQKLIVGHMFFIPLQFLTMYDNTGTFFPVASNHGNRYITLLSL